MEWTEYFILVAGFALVPALFMLYLLFRRTQERVVEESKLSAMLSRSRSMRAYFERLDEIVAELSILRNRVEKMELKLRDIEKEERKND
jgi:hypothetical protein